MLQNGCNKAANSLRLAANWLQNDCITAAAAAKMQPRGCYGAAISAKWLQWRHCSAALWLQYLQNDFNDVIEWLYCGCKVCKLAAIAAMKQICSDIAAIMQRYCSHLQWFCRDFAAKLQLCSRSAGCSQIAYTAAYCSRWFSKFAGGLHIGTKSRFKKLIRKERLLDIKTEYIRYKFNQISI